MNLVLQNPRFISRGGNNFFSLFSDATMYSCPNTLISLFYSKAYVSSFVSLGDWQHVVLTWNITDGWQEYFELYSLMIKIAQGCILTENFFGTPQ